MYKRKQGGYNKNVRWIPLQGQKLPGTVRFAQPIGRRTVAVDTTKDNLEILILPFLRRLPEFSGSLLLRAAMKCNRLAD